MMDKKINVKMLGNLSQIISKSDFCVLYEPLLGEIDPHILPLTLPSRRIITSLDHRSDPKKSAQNVCEKFHDLNGFILIPGHRFDKFGGRHGRGYGWYDRFLSNVPVVWKKIGVCTRSQFSEIKLPLEEWDVLMNVVIVEDHGIFIIYETKNSFA